MLCQLFGHETREMHDSPTVRLGLAEDQPTGHLSGGLGNRQLATENVDTPTAEGYRLTPTKAPVRQHEDEAAIRFRRDS
jgi:hypothetical protein